MKLRYLPCLASSLVLASAGASADIKVNGFVSLVGGLTSNESETLYGYDSDFSANPDTLVGIQGVADLGDKLSATVQFTTRGDEDFEVDLEWAYISYDYSEKVCLNVGLLRVPYFNYSDFLDVGYAYYWVRPPESVYAFTFQNLTGASLLLSDSFGSWDVSLQLLAGRNNIEEIPVAGVPSPFDANNFVGGAFEFEKGWFLGRAGFYQGKISLDSTLLSGATGNIAAGGFTELADRLLVEDDTGSFSHVGFTIDDGSFLLNAEWRQINAADSVLQFRTGWYVSTGYRIGKWTPHVTVEAFETTRPGQFDALLEGAPPPVLGGANALLGALSGDTEAYSVGFRYDFHPSAAFKMEYTSYDDNLNPANDADLLSFGIDLLF